MFDKGAKAMIQCGGSIFNHWTSTGKTNRPKNKTKQNKKTNLDMDLTQTGNKKINHLKMDYRLKRKRQNSQKITQEKMLMTSSSVMTF